MFCPVFLSEDRSVIKDNCRYFSEQQDFFLSCFLPFGTFFLDFFLQHFLGDFLLTSAFLALHLQLVFPKKETSINSPSQYINSALSVTKLSENKRRNKMAAILFTTARYKSYPKFKMLTISSKSLKISTNAKSVF